ncbi:IPT/TIG domain-containing protein [Mucilaginibacter sp. L196]|uniref:IPT/TIG domain-containing protein n=1 Tax=Mucilaginibacter sp. L196 TaxID=1641870 RepID=UPI00131D7D46|nr:IPT/TIG domain-containing protein [Mucilaginibacter sp. L196]
MKQFLKYSISIMLVSIIATMYISCQKGPNFEIVQYPAQTVTGMTPNSGYPGTYITISGKNFGTLTGAVKVWFGGVKADSIISCANTQIVAKVPATAITGKVTLQVWTHTNDSIGNFTVIPPPTITGTSNSAAAPGDTFTITGTNFGTSISAIQVKFSGTSATVTAVTSTQITVTVPTSFTSGNVIVYVNGYPVVGPAIAYLVSVPDPVYQLDFENNLTQTIGIAPATYIQGSASSLTYITGISGKAAYLAGYLSTAVGDNNQAISLPQNVAQYNELSVSCWVLYDGSGTNSDYGTPIFSFGHTRGNNITLDASTGYPALNQQISAAVVFENVTGFSGYNNYPLATTKSIVGTAWHHLVMTLSKSSLTENIYLDGALIASQALPAAYDLTAYVQDRNYLGVGCVSNTGEPGMKGGIDKFQIYNSVLTANQVYTLYFKK